MKTCAERIDQHLEDRITDLEALWELYHEDTEAYHDDLGHIYEYGLCFDYVAPGTFSDQNEGYFRYQLSTGGPGDEFRIYANQSGPYSWSVYRIEYWFLDWFDGAHRHLQGTDFNLVEDIFQGLFVDTGTATKTHTDSLRGE